MAGEWRDVALEDVADELTVGYVGPMASEYVDEGIPFLRSLNVDPLRINKNDLKFITPEFHSRIRKSRLTPGDVVIVRTGKPGACSVVPEWLTDANCSDLVIVRCGPQLDNRFLAYYVNTVACDHVAAHLVGAVQQHFNVGSARTLRLKLPPLAKQKAIAAVLGALDDKIELNRRMNTTLETMARALFQSWFGDFDPVRAKLDGRKPAGLDPATAAFFPDSFQDSALGEIPNGWRLGTLGELVQLRTDRVDATPDKDSTRYIALEDMPSRSIDLSHFQLGSAVNSSITAFRKGDVLFGSMRPYFHKVGLAFFDGITRTTTFVLRPKKDCFRHFSLLHFFSDDVVAHSTTASVGTTIPYVRWDSMESYRIPIPPDPLLEAFEKTVSPLVQRIAAQGEESRTFATMRDTLLPKLLSGELSVPAA